MNGITFTHFLNQKPGATSDSSFSLISSIQFLSKSYWYNIQLCSASDHLSPLHCYHGHPSHHYPWTSSTTASSLFSWLSLLSSNHQQNPLLIALVRLHYSTAENLSAVASHTWNYKAYRSWPAYFSHLSPTTLTCLVPTSEPLHLMFLLSGMPFPHKSTWLSPSLPSGLWPATPTLFEGGFHHFITHYFPTLLPFSSHVCCLAL